MVAVRTVVLQVLDQSIMRSDLLLPVIVLTGIHESSLSHEFEKIQSF